MAADLDFSLVELFQTAVADPGLWQFALEKLMVSFDGLNAQLFSTEAACRQPLAVYVGMTAADVARFRSPDAVRLWTPWRKRLEPGKITASWELLPDHDMERNELYNEFVRGLGTFHAAFAQVDQPDMPFHLVICREKSRGAFGKREIRKVQSLLPYLTNAVALHAKLNATERFAGRLTEILDRISSGILMTDASGVLLFANRRAQEILGAQIGLSLEQDRLQAADALTTQELHGAIWQAASTACAPRQRLKIGCRPGPAFLLLEIMSLGDFSSSLGCPADHTALIFVTEPHASSEIDSVMLMDTYQLTPREAEVAASLATGVKLEAIATKLGLAINTVRYHLKQVFEKTGTRNQAALVALIRNLSGH